MNPVVVLAQPNSLESRALTAWLWEWDIPCIEQVGENAGKLMTVVDGKPFCR